MNKIYVIEGLTGEIFGYCRKPLIKAGFEVSWFPWWWPNIQIPDGAIVVAHSLGAGRAISLVNEGKIKPKLLITIDPRLEPKGGFAAIGSGFRTHGVRIGYDSYNFYQTGFMKGYPVKWAENHLVEGYRHTALPQYMGIIETIRKYL